MHSDREKLVERLHHAITTASNDDMSRPGTHMRERHTARLAAIEDAIAALSEPVKDEPVVQWRVGEWGDGSTKPGEAVIFCDAHEAAVAAGVPSHLAKMIVEAHNDTVNAGERPAVAVKADRAKDDQYWSVVEQRANLEDDNARLREALEDERHCIRLIVEAAGPRDENDDIIEHVAKLRSLASPALTAGPQAVPEGMVLVPQSALDWLMGAGPDHNGNWFGEGERGPGAFWWRLKFTAMCRLPSSPRKEGSGDA